MEWNESLSTGFRQKPGVFSRKTSFNLVTIGRKANEDKNIFPFVRVDTQCCGNSKSYLSIYST